MNATRRAMKWGIAIFMAGAVFPCHCLGDADSELNSWYLYNRGQSAETTEQPESPAHLLRRLKPRIDHEAACKTIESRMQAVTLASINFHDAPLGVVINRLNALIREHNPSDPFSPLPLLKLKIQQDDQSTDGPYIAGLNQGSRSASRAFGSCLITAKFPSQSVDATVRYIASLAGLSIVLEPDSIEFIPSSWPLHLLTQKF